MSEELSSYEQLQPRLAHQRALILKILAVEEREGNNDGLTTQQIIEKELKYFKYSFLTDNRLRELRKSGYVESVDRLGKPQLWRLKKEKTT